MTEDSRSGTEPRPRRAGGRAGSRLVQLSGLHARDVGRPGACSPRAFPPLALRPTRAWWFARPVRSLQDRRPRERRAGAAGQVGDRKRFVLRPLYRRARRHVAGERSARARRASGAVLHSSPIRPRDVRRPRQQGQGRGCRFYCRRGARALVHARVPRRPSGDRGVGREHAARHAGGRDTRVAARLSGTPTCGAGSGGSGLPRS